MRATIAFVLLVWAGNVWGQTDWSTWSQDPDRLAFADAHGWVISDNDKTEGLPVITLPKGTAFSLEAAGIEPAPSTPTNFVTASGKVLQVHSVKRLETLYQRWLANEKNGL